MPDPTLPFITLARPFLSLVNAVFNHCNLLHKERQAGQGHLSQSTDIADGILDQTLDRLRSGNIDDQWWRRILDRFAQEYIAPDSLRSPIWQKWLADTKVTDDLKLLAKERIMHRDQDPKVRIRLTQSYPDRTYEIHPVEAEPMDVVVAILIAGYINSIPDDQQPVAGMIQMVQTNVDERFDKIEEKFPETFSCHITQRTHTKYAEQELSRILTLRVFYPSKSQTDIQELINQVLEGVSTQLLSQQKLKFYLGVPGFWLKIKRLCL